MYDGVCPGPQIGVVFRRVRLDLGAGQCRGRSEVRVTIDDHHVTHCPEGNADPSHQADVHCGRRVGIGGKEESILVPEKLQRDQPRTIMAGSRHPRVDVMIKSLPGVHYALIHASRSRHIQDPTAAFPSCLGIPLRSQESASRLDTVNIPAQIFQLQPTTVPAPTDDAGRRCLCRTGTGRWSRHREIPAAGQCHRGTVVRVDRRLPKLGSPSPPGSQCPGPPGTATPGRFSRSDCHVNACHRPSVAAMRIRP